MREQDDEGSERRRFERLFDRHRRPLLGYALRRVDDPADAADVLAETFLIAWRRLAAVPSGEGERPWLLAVARRVLANQRRGAARRDGLSERLGQELAVGLPQVMPCWERDLLRAALAQLSDDDREVVLLAGWEGLEPAQIATVLGIRGVTARSRLHRARRRLRAELTALGWDDEPTPILDLATEQPR
jgi:RNA polymerase sigma-70 factor (ECF subfamily)